MDWLVVNPQFYGTFASLGSQIGDTYTVNEDCLATLCDILGKLTIEDRTLRTYRRAIGFAQVVKKDLLPLLVGVRDDSKITDMTIKILLNLTVPVECLLPMDVMLKTDAGRYTVMELSMLLSTSKEAFVPSQSTRPVVDHMKAILEKESKLSTQDCESISNCLLLLRNILHIPEHRSSGSVVSMQNQILWNLFSQNLDKVLIQLMTSQYKGYWCVAMVQLVALMFKDQQVGTLQTLLNLWFESSLSDSSEGNESNTSPQHQASGDSSSLMTSDPTSDSSDNGGSNKKRSSYQTGDSKSINIESDDSQSSEPGSAHEVTGNQASSSDCEHKTAQAQPQTRLSHSHSSKLRVKSLCELQARPRRFDKHNDSDMDTSDVHSSQGTSHSSSWLRHKHNLALGHMTNHGHETNHIGSHANVKDHYGKSHLQGHETLTKSFSTHNVSAHPKPLGKKNDASSEMSDCGYGTQQENQESNSTSSNEDDAPHRCVKHQKPQHMLQKSRYNGKSPITAQERKELHRKKLVKRSHTNTMHMKALLHHLPSDDDISNLLKEFTVDFLLRGYGCLVEVLHHHLLARTPVQMDTSHFFWLVTYFLKFATQLELDLDHISSVLTIDVVSYLIYEGVNLYEELQMGITNSCRDLKPCLRRMHLVITSIREFIQAVEAYMKISHLTEEDRNHLMKLQLQIVDVQDLRGLFVLLLRQFNPSLQSQQFLQDLIVTNHNLLIFIEKTSKLPQCHTTIDLVEHLQQFGTSKVMFNYGLLLENFLNNGEFVNDCIFTMMHHVAGDLSRVHVLFQPSILKCLSHVGDADYDICDDWSDLIEYVIHKFMKTRSCSQSTVAPDKQHILASNAANSKLEWTKEDCNSLYWYYQQNCDLNDPIGAITDMYKKSCVSGKTRIGVIQQLWLQDVISEQQYESYMEAETSLLMLQERSPLGSVPEGLSNLSPTFGTETNTEAKVSTEGFEETDDIRTLGEKITGEGYGKVIAWLQSLFLELCYVKLNLLHGLLAVMEPTPYIYTKLHQSTPVVPWYTEQERCLSNPTFILLLHKLGLHLAGDAGKIFPRIPHFWTADVLFEKAEKIGVIHSKNTKFNLNLVNSGACMEEHMTHYNNSATYVVESKGNVKGAEKHRTSSGIGSEVDVFRVPSVPPGLISSNRPLTTPIVSSMPNWLQVVQKSKCDTSSLQTLFDKERIKNIFSHGSRSAVPSSNLVSDWNTPETRSKPCSKVSTKQEADDEKHSLLSSAMDINVNEQSQKSSDSIVHLHSSAMDTNVNEQSQKSSDSVLQQHSMAVDNREMSSAMDISQT